MDRKQLWEMFQITGSPEVYLLYRDAVKREQTT